MAKRSKKYRAAAEKILPGILYSPFEAMKLAKETSVTSFPSTVEGVVRLGDAGRPRSRSSARAPFDRGPATDAVRRRLRTARRSSS